MVFKVFSHQATLRLPPNKHCIDGQNEYATILPTTVPVKKIKSAARQCYGDGDGVVWYEQTFKL